MSYLWLVILEFRPSNPAKTGGLALNRSVWEQALPDLTASILANIHKNEQHVFTFPPSY